MLTQSQKKKILDDIAKANGGILLPETVIRLAKNPKHPLHPYFDWDDAIAAHQYRLDQARDLISSIEVLVEYEDRVVTAISYIHSPGSKDQGYIAVDALAKKPEEARQALQIELERIMGSVARGRSIAGGLGLEPYFEAILQNALKAQSKLKK